MKAIKSFFKTVKYEFIRVGRNKVLASLLLIFTVVILFFMSFVTIDKSSYKIAIFTDGIAVEEYEALDTILTETDNNQFIYVNSVEEGKELVIRQKVVIFFAFDKETDPVRATMFYDSRTAFGRTIKEKLQEYNTNYIYNTLVDFLKEYGITIDSSFFNRTDFVSATESNITGKQMMFSMAVGMCLAIIISFGLAYSISRDNETNVSRNISYTPISTSKYLFSKILVYFSLGILEIGVCLLLGWLFFKINIQMNAILIMLLTSFFVISIVMMGLMFSLLKSQISTALFNMIAILIPMFMLTIGHISSFPLILQIILNFSPLTPFVNFLNSLMFNGIIIWESIAIFLLQSVVYYLITFLVLKRRVKK